MSNLNFEFKGKKYKPVIPAVYIPGLGKRTAAEICDDVKAQAFLVKEGCVGSVIEEVKEQDPPPPPPAQ